MMAKEATEYQKGEVLDITLTGDKAVGDVIVLGDSMIGVTASAGLSGETIAVEVEKVWTINAKTADAISIGDFLYWDATNKELTTTATDNTKAGVAVSAKGATVAGTVNIKINVG
jgi:predicted RecA/RadA family phage recombinase